MKVIIINQSEVAELMPMGECIGVMTRALVALARGEAILPLRQTLRLSDESLLCLMPSYLKDIQAVGAKVISVFPGNRERGLDSHQGAVLLFEAKRGSLVAVVDATAITAIRTAAVSAVATQLLARPEVQDLAILGSGTQARAHLEAMLLVRKIRRARVWSLPTEDAFRFAKIASQRYRLPIEACETAQEAVTDADLICTTTSAREPVLKGDWISPGAHINAVGSSVPSTRELDSPAVAKSRLFVDRRESAVNEAGDFLFPMREGVISEKHIRGEIGELLLGRLKGRTSPDEITLFKSLGLAIEDLAAAHYIYQKAREKQAGTLVELGGRYV